MTYAEREAIFAKDVMTIQEFAALQGISYKAASAKMRTIKIKMQLNGRADKLNVEGKLLIEDYLWAFGLSGRHIQAIPADLIEDRRFINEVLQSN